MIGYDDMKTSDFDYQLDDNLIADVPPDIRGSSRLLALNKKTGEYSDGLYTDLIDFLHPGDVLVLNDTKVIKARITAQKANGATRELILIEKHGTTDDWHYHKVLYRKKISKGDILTVGAYTLQVEEILGDGIAQIKSEKDLLELSQEIGTVPLPPYMRREATEQDIERYQTVWADDAGSVAAPTASLNMTAEALREIEKKGIKVCYATLHVGLGTFLPIRVDDVATHTMHKEFFVLPKETITSIRDAKKINKRVFALGTTITRTLEYNGDYIVSDDPAVDKHGDADIFIYPGYSFKVIDGLITNFHAPRSTVLMLTAAFAGWEHLLPAYNHATATHYSFLSYGDSMVIY